MSEQFKIRKNKSQKEIHMAHDNSRKTPTLYNPKPTKNRPTSNFYTYKVAHLQPLMRTKASVHHSSDNHASLKLDYTQPMPQKSSSMNKHEVKSEAFHLIPLDLNIPAKVSSIDKENRPASINEIKYPTISKVQSNLLKTEKYQSLKIYAGMTDPCMPVKDQKENHPEQKKGQLMIHKMSKKKLLKATSRSKLAKLHGKPPQESQVFVYPAEIETEPDMNYRTFRKGIINKIFCHTRNNQIISEHHELDCQELPKQKMKINGQDSAEQKIVDEELLQSPIMKKEMNSYWANCSTIKEQQESCCSVISRETIEELINFKQVSEPTPFVEHKGIDRRRKIDNDRIKKKFPENFFK